MSHTDARYRFEKISPGKRSCPSILAWTKNPKLGVGGSLLVANDVSILKRMFSQNFWIFKKKLAKGSAYLVFNGIYHGKNLQKPKFFILGTKTHLYEHICHPHIEEDQTKPVCFMREKKSVRSRKSWLIWDLRFLSLRWSSIVTAKIINVK